MAEVNDLMDRGMMDNYDQESEHSVTAEVPTTEADTSLPPKMETVVLTIGYLLSGKCCRDGGLYGKQPHQCFAYSSGS